jgi:hypothetical protein
MPTNSEPFRFLILPPRNLIARLLSRVPRHALSILTLSLFFPMPEQLGRWSKDTVEAPFLGRWASYEKGNGSRRSLREYRGYTFRLLHCVVVSHMEESVMFARKNDLTVLTRNKISANWALIIQQIENEKNPARELRKSLPIPTWTWDMWLLIISCSQQRCHKVDFQWSKCQPVVPDSLRYLPGHAIYNSLN